MELLAVSDEVAREVYTPGVRERFGNVKLVLGCGDLPPSYLEFLVSALDVPCLYVHGNHDGQGESTEQGQTVWEPQGAISIDGRVGRYAGLTIAGLGGSIWYNGGKYQYTEAQMIARVMLLLPRLLLWQQRDGHRLDIFLSHAPPAGIHDGPRAHRGFKALRYLLHRVQPRYWLHGHVHKSYGYNHVYHSVVGATTVINTVPYQALTIEPVGATASEQARAVG